MNKLTPLLLLLLIIAGCKKKDDESAVVDYNYYDYARFGKNMITLTLDHPLALFPIINDRGNWGFMDRNGNTVINAGFKSVSRFSHNMASAWVESNYHLKRRSY